VDAYERDGQELTLTGDDVRLAFDAEPPPEPLPLVGTLWGLQALATGSDAVTSPVVGTVVTLELQDDGTAMGSGGCNQFNTSYETDGDTISFSPIAGTLMECEPDVSDLEAVYLAALDSAATFEIVGDDLTLSDSDGAFLMSFRGA
jgi:heat shock protein HslJ